VLTCRKTPINQLINFYIHHKSTTVHTFFFSRADVDVVLCHILYSFSLYTYLAFEFRGGNQCLLGDLVTEVKSKPVSTWMGDRQGRMSTVNLCPFVSVDLNL